MVSANRAVLALNMVALEKIENLHTLFIISVSEDFRSFFQFIIILLCQAPVLS